MAVIYFLSTDHLSAPEVRRTWTGFLAAKGAHFLEYAGLFLLWYRAIHGTLRAWNPAAAILAFAAASAYAVLDEFHQSLTTHRSGNAQDILLDSFGAGFAMIALWAMPRWKGRGAWKPGSGQSRLGRESWRPPPDRSQL
jgi:VanZ family protein